MTESTIKVNIVDMQEF